ncbi:MAG: hypothetical protein RJB62_1285 [Pseudomonadota bacterium]|jgi:hypothetical protein
MPKGEQRSTREKKKPKADKLKKAAPSASPFTPPPSKAGQKPTGKPGKK